MNEKDINEFLHILNGIQINLQEINLKMPESKIENADALIKFRKIFYSRLEEKTNWGRNQIIELVNTIVHEIRD